MLKEIREDVDGVRLQRTHRPGATEFIPVGIERTHPKRVDHREAPSFTSIAEIAVTA
jgi:hypothetical protein